MFGATTIAKAGAFAEHVVADAKNVGSKPSSISFHQAAAMTIVGMTAWNGLVGRAKLTAGQSVFVNGCMGGVGRSAVQLARMYGAHVVGSCGISGHGDALALGVAEAIDYRTFDPAAYRDRFDVVFDTAGSLSVRQCGTMLRTAGVSLHIVPTFAKMIGCALSSRHHLVFGNPTPQCLAGVTDSAGCGFLVPEIGRVVPLSETIAAIVALETTGSLKGKLVIVPG